MEWISEQHREVCTLGRGLLKMTVFWDGVTGKGYRVTVGDLTLKGHFPDHEVAKKAAEDLVRRCFLVMMDELVI